MDTTLSQTSTTLLQGVADGGNPHAERTFVKRYGRLALAVVRAARVHPNDCDDVVQEALSAAMQGLREHRYDRPRGPFKAWFKGILFHKIEHDRRARARRVEQRLAAGSEALKDVADQSPGPPEQLEAAFEEEWASVIFKEACDDVRQRVDPVNWQAYDLVERGRKAGEVAHLLGIRRSQVYNAVSRIRAHLRQTIADLTAP